MNETLTQYGTVVPAFQPILDMDKLQILGYEALGRGVDEATGELRSLGGLFHSLNADDPEDAQTLIDLDRILQEQALQKLKAAPGDFLLFFNITPRILARMNQERRFQPQDLSIVSLVEQYEVSPRRIVLEITEDDFDGELGELVHMVQALKDYGFHIAVDDLGAAMSGLTRLAYIQPDIIKVDLNFLRNSISHSGFQQLLMAISFVSQRLGAELLFEGIEEEEELMAAMKMGGRLLQGWLFSKAMPEFQQPDAYEEYLRSILEDYSRFRVAELTQSYHQRDEVVRHFSEALDLISLNDLSTVNRELFQVLEHAPRQAMRVALYDFLGNQVSALFRRTGQGWEPGEDSFSNISWRTFFQQTLASYRVSRQTIFYSEPYQGEGTPLIRSSIVLDSNFVLIAEMNWTE